MWFSIDYNSGIPIYIQIKNGIKNEILNRRMKNGENLPSIREFARMLKVNQNTVAKSLKELEREGILVAIPGIGYKLNSNFEKIKNVLLKSLEDKLFQILEEYEKLGVEGAEIEKIIEKYYTREVKNGRRVINRD